MVPPIAADLLLLARVLMLWPVSHRRSAARRILEETEVAFAYRRLFGKMHPRFGDGSLMSRSLAEQPRPEPLASDPDYLHALRIAVSAMLAHSGR